VQNTVLEVSIYYENRLHQDDIFQFPNHATEMPNRHFINICGMLLQKHALFKKKILRDRLKKKQAH